MAHLRYVSRWLTRIRGSSAVIESFSALPDIVGKNSCSFRTFSRRLCQKRTECSGSPSSSTSAWTPNGQPLDEKLLMGLSKLLQANYSWVPAKLAKFLPKLPANKFFFFACQALQKWSLKDSEQVLLFACGVFTIVWLPVSEGILGDTNVSVNKTVREQHGKDESYHAEVDGIFPPQVVSRKTNSCREELYWPSFSSADLS